ncbi:beta-glucosidase 11-like [Senna tora]|uniref:Beta-glucosidase 11-like n=1 Tax=Senna tora TaxID=362788 RepID=A0A834TD67_9FABA|nr:beta-glucosidase 11-like [Senna tora]
MPKPKSAPKAFAYTDGIDLPPCDDEEDEIVTEEEDQQNNVSSIQQQRPLYNMTAVYGDRASDQYHKYKEDVGLMAKMGLNAYRLSISWSRLIPNIQPHVTLHHSDLPQALEDEYGGWLSRRVVKDFKAYADVCFREFGNRVKHWITMNEANMFAQAGYDLGIAPPQRCTPSSFFNCANGNSSTEPYIAAHHLLLAHASAAALYRKNYQEKQNGLIGINIFTYGISPLTNSTEDLSATQRAEDFNTGWFLSPIMLGEYPETMKKNIGSRLPSFTKTESNLVKGSIDFLGINYYYTCYAKNNPTGLVTIYGHILADMAFDLIGIFDDHQIETPFRPWGLQNLLELLKNSYSNIPVYIYENGQKTLRGSSLDDWARVKFLSGYIKSTLDALRDGSNVRGYFVWSFVDLLELLSGYKAGYGLLYVDQSDPDLNRYPKLSATWYSQFLHGKSVDPNITTELDNNTPMLSLHNASLSSLPL